MLASELDLDVAIIDSIELWLPKHDHHKTQLTSVSARGEYGLQTPTHTKETLSGEGCRAREESLGATCSLVDFLPSTSASSETHEDNIK